MEGKKFLTRIFKKYFFIPISRKAFPFLFPSIRFIPQEKTKFESTVPTHSSWAGLEEIIPAILNQFNIPKETCIEFGVEYGYSTGIFAQLFSEVTGVDTFKGDAHTGYKDTYQKAKNNLRTFQNVNLVRCSYQEFIHSNHQQYDLCHVDIIHTYKDTFACGEWAVNHCKCVLFHDTMSFPEVRRAVYNLAKKYGKTFYNYPFHYGLGIIV